MLFKLLLSICFLLLWEGGPSFAQKRAGDDLLGRDPVDARHTEARLISEAATIAPGQPFTLALHMTPERGWHTYWSNPGDSGIATSIDWQLPAGFEAGTLRYPTPRKVPFGPLMNYGYGEANSLLVTVTPPGSLAKGDLVTLRAHAYWLACDDEMCVPEEDTFSLSLPIGDGAPDPQYIDLFAKARDALPKHAPWPVNHDVKDGRLLLKLLASPGDMQIEDAWFFPYGNGVIPYAAAQEMEISDDAVYLRVAAGDSVKTPVEGVLSLKVKGNPDPEGFEISAPRTAIAWPDGAGSGGAGEAPAGPSLWAALGLALLGGLILNLMPCVFPVLSLKALALAKHGGHVSKAREHAIFYTAGILLSFLLIAAILIAIRAAGQEVGWGFQLQSPWLVALLAFLMFVVGLNLIGAFEVGGRLMGLGGRLTQGEGRLAALATGVLAVIVATPCTAPLMAPALGFALVQPAPVALLVFLFLGLGLALPFLLLAFAPPLHRLMPKPGVWMESFKQFLAFPMFATALWLVWVVGRQGGLGAMVSVLGGLILIGFAVWAWGRSDRRSHKARTVWRIAALGGLALAFLAAWQADMRAQIAQVEPRALAADAFSPEKLAALRAEGAPVFVYFTAAWCITCKFNEQVALETEQVSQAFAANGVKILKGDWTLRDPMITRTLRSYGRSGVPLYLFFPKGAEKAVILPQTLTPSIVIEAIKS